MITVGNIKRYKRIGKFILHCSKTETVPLRYRSMKYKHARKFEILSFDKMSKKMFFSPVEEEKAIIKTLNVCMRETRDFRALRNNIIFVELFHCVQRDKNLLQM